MNTRWSKRNEERKLILKLISRLPASAQKKLISGYIGINIQATHLEKLARWKNWEQRDENETILKNEDKDWPLFKSCYQAEAEYNGLWLGNLQFKAFYEKSTFLRLDSIETWNTFTHSFKECAISKIKEFKPQNNTKISLTFYL